MDQSSRYLGWDLPSSIAQLGSPFSNGSQFMPFEMEFTNSRDGRLVRIHLDDEKLYRCYQEFCIRHPDVVESGRNQARIIEEMRRKEKEGVKLKQNVKLLL